MRKHIKVMTGLLVASTTFGVNAATKYSDIEVKYIEGIFNNKIVRKNTVDRKSITIVPNNTINSQISAFKRRYNK